MKRIANNVALQTILYIIAGTQKIRVIDCNDRFVESGSECVFNGYYKDFHREVVNSWRIERAKVFRIEVDADTNYIVFYICTNRDTF